MTDNDDNFIRVGRKRPSDATRARLLEAGRQMILDRGLSSTLPLRVADVAASVGHTTGAAYQLWPSQADFQRALSEHLLSISYWSHFQDDADLMVQAVNAGADAGEIIRSAGNAFFERLVSRPEFYVYLHFWAVGYHDPSLHGLMKRGYDEFRQQLTTTYSALLEHLGLTMAAPFTIDHLATTITALAEGLALRHLVDPSRAGERLAFEDSSGAVSDWSLFSCAIEAVVHAYTEPA